MKKCILIIISILSIVSCNKFKSSLIPKIQCLIKNEAIDKFMINLIELIKSKNVSKIISSLIKEYPNLEKEIFKCWNDIDIKLLFPMKILKKKPFYKCVGNCYSRCSKIKKYFEYVICADECIEKNCNKKNNDV